MDELCLYDLGLGFDCLVYPDPPPPLVLELVEELPGECWDDIPPGPGPGGDETLVDDVVPWTTAPFPGPPEVLEDPTDPLTVNCILFSHLSCSGKQIGVSTPFISEPSSLVNRGSVPLEFNESLFSSFSELLFL